MSKKSKKKLEDIAYLMKIEYYSIEIPNRKEYEKIFNILSRAYTQRVKWQIEYRTQVGNYLKYRLSTTCKSGYFVLEVSQNNINKPEKSYALYINNLPSKIPSNKKIFYELDNTLVRNIGEDKLVVRKSAQETPKQPRRKTKDELKFRRKLTAQNCLIVTYIRKCTNLQHKLRSVAAIFDVVTPSGDIIEETALAAYCQKCDTYYILYPEYLEVRSKGVLLCTIIEDIKLRRDSLFHNYKNSESILMVNGYNVKASKGLTDEQRQTILANLINQDVLSSAQIISYLSTFRSQKVGLPGYELAVAKWDADIEFVRNYKRGDLEKIFVKSAYVTTYVKVNR